MKKESKASLSRKISLLVLVMVISSAAIVGLISYYLYRRDSIAVGADKARSIAETISSAIDAEQFEDIMSTGVKNQYWHDTKRFADDVKVRTGLLYLYILDKNYDTSVKYFMEGNAPQDTDLIDLWDEEPVDVHADELFETLRTGLPTTTGMYTAEGFGRMVSGFAPVLDSRGSVIGVVGVDIGMNDVMRSSNIFGIMTIICVVVFSAVFCLISIRYIANKVGKPIAALSAASEKLAVGDMDVGISVSSGDEIGRLTMSFKEMAESTKKQITILEKLAGGDLTSDIIPRCERDSMGIAIKMTVDNLNSIFAEISGNSESVSSGAVRISNVAQSLARGAAEQATAVEKLEGSIAQVADKARDNAAMADKAAALADTIKDSAERSSLQMERMMRAVSEISDASQSIGRVIKTIDDIAFQTNILALNAAVEAARAGQHGKGFAIVAEEVRNLAAKSAEAAKDTGSLIANSMEKAELGARMADETAGSLTGIVSGVNESSKIMGEIVKFSEEQSAAIARINDDIEHVAEVIRQNSATAEESAASSQDLNSQSDILQAMLAKLKLRTKHQREIV